MKHVYRTLVTLRVGMHPVTLRVTTQEQTQSVQGGIRSAI